MNDEHGWTVGVIQARMGSTRLPGKVLMDIAGTPMLDRVVRRLRRAETVDEVVVATTTLAMDDVIVERAGELGVRAVRGDALDVLSRYADAARLTGATVVVRVTSDCPFLDPQLVDLVVTSLQEAGADYAANAFEPRTYPRGLDVEAMTAAALLDADANDDDPATREHVTPYLRSGDRYRIADVTGPEVVDDVRWTVDTPEDLQVVRAMAEAADGGEATPWTELLELWRAHPEWHAMNAHIVQKRVGTDQG